MKTNNHICRLCSNNFTSLRSDAKYCSDACKQYAFRTRHQSSNVIIPIGITNDDSQSKSIPIQPEKINNEALNYFLQSLEDSTNKRNEKFKELHDEIIQRNIDRANTNLKSWLTKLIEFENLEEVRLFSAKSLYETILNCRASSYTDFTDDYKYTPFIEKSLIPQMQSWCSQLKNMRYGYVCQEMESELKSRIMQVLSELP